MLNRLLAIDPGAERCGWAIMSKPEGKPILVNSGILGVHRNDGEPFQDYKLRLTEYWATKIPGLFYKYQPLVTVNEIVPAVGGGNFILATQSELAKTVVTIMQAFAYSRAMTVRQIAASTIKKKLTGNKDATKAKVRNAVIEQLPDLKDELRKETTGDKPVWDRSDAIGTGLVYLSMVD
jgi:Holliday junction resolvasome RuvABC endonuclease subunit